MTLLTTKMMIGGMRPSTNPTLAFFWFSLVMDNSEMITKEMMTRRAMHESATIRRRALNLDREQTGCGTPRLRVSSVGVHTIAYHHDNAAFSQRMLDGSGARFTTKDLLHAHSMVVSC